MFDWDLITLSAAVHAHVIESDIISPCSMRLFYPCLDTTNPFSFTCITPVASIAPVCAVTQQERSLTAFEPGRNLGVTILIKYVVSVNTNNTKQNKLLELAIWPEACSTKLVSMATWLSLFWANLNDYWQNFPQIVFVFAFFFTPKLRCISTDQWGLQSISSKKKYNLKENKETQIWW